MNNNTSLNTMLPTDRLSQKLKNKIKDFACNKTNFSAPLAAYVRFPKNVIRRIFLLVGSSRPNPTHKVLLKRAKIQKNFVQKYNETIKIRFIYDMY